VNLGGGVLEVPQSPAFPLANSDSAHYEGSFWIRERNAKRLPFLRGTRGRAAFGIGDFTKIGYDVAFINLARSTN
jgi:hypothetical protein